MCSQSLFQVPHQARLFGCYILWTFWIAQWHLEQALYMGLTNFCHGNQAIALADLEILWIETLNYLSHSQVPLCVVVGRSRDDQWRPGFVDQHIVNLVDDGINVTTLYPILQAHGHVVTQVIKSEFIICAVSDVGGVYLSPEYHV